jgi:class 3 adenylate cyclase/tetratricopeptide (TPR) repeat protein
VAADGRRVVAILIADVVGYSALADRDEDLALRVLGRVAALLRPLLERFGGREVKTMGDGFLVEFADALAATECAIAVQRELHEQALRADGARVQMRIGVHVGEVLHQGGDVLGQTVNVAARVEPLAEASGICLTGAVVERVAHRIPFSCTRLEHAFLKNIATPLAVFSVDLPWHSPPAARVTPWIDRVAELATLGEAVREAARGRGGAVALAGEPGVGKTRLAEEIAHSASRDGFRVLRGRGFEQELGAPYALWSEAARSFLRDASDAAVTGAAERCVDAVVTLAPELADRLGPLRPRGDLDPDSARLRFFEGVLRFFRNVARHSPVMILLDDAQWADAGSLALLEYVGARVRSDAILLLVLYRDVEADPGGTLRHALGNLQRARFLREIALRRLDDDTARLLIAAILGAEGVPPDLFPPVLEKTGGNPYFVEELLRALVEEGALVLGTDGWSWKSPGRVGIPSTVREAVRRRVDRASPEVRETLAVASVLGSQFAFEVLEEVSGVEREALLHRVEALLRARLLHEREAAPGRSVLRFGDEQIREVLYEDLPRLRRRLYHGRTAATLERRVGAQGDERAAELARHWVEAGEPDKALAYAERAGDWATRVHAYDDAARSFGLARDLADRQGDDAACARLSQREGDALYAAGQLEAARAAWIRAAERDRRLGRDGDAGHAYVCVAASAWEAEDNEPLFREYYAKALRLLSATDGSAVARLYETASKALGTWGDAEGARAAAENALALGERLDDPELSAFGHIATAFVATEKSTALTHLGRAAAIGRERGLPPISEVYELAANVAMWIRGDWKGYERMARATIEEARRTGLVTREHHLWEILGVVYAASGHLDQARATLPPVQRLERRLSLPPSHGVSLRAVLALRDGDLERARVGIEGYLSLLERTAPRHDGAVHAHNIAGEIALEQGDAARAIVHFGQTLAIVRERASPIFLANFELEADEGLVSAHLARGDADAAIASVERAEARVHRADEELHRARARRARGRFELASGNPNPAAHSLREAAEGWQRLDFPYDLARTLAELGAAYAAGGEAEKARDSTNRALGIFRRIGAPTDEARTRARADWLAA